MKYQPAFDIWQVPVDLLKHAQPGQHVYAGDKVNKGIFYGVKKSGSVVVAWQGNWKRVDRADYMNTLRLYARG